MEDGATESAPLLGGKESSSRARARAYLAEKIRVNNAYIPLLICCFLTGLIDAGSYNAWSVFMGMQTGTLRSAFSHLLGHSLSFYISVRFLLPQHHVSNYICRKYNLPRPLHISTPFRQRLLKMGPLPHLHHLPHTRFLPNRPPLLPLHRHPPRHPHLLLPRADPLYRHRRPTGAYRCGSRSPFPFALALALLQGHG